MHHGESSVAVVGVKLAASTELARHQNVRRKITVYIDDLGPGLPAGREDALFDKFERGSKESATPGVGLGLAIARAIVQAHHGRIDASNRLGPNGIAGARFSIALPRGKPPEDDGSASAADSP